ncbi:hypothetical protein BCR42DRAFT_99792 [Absidia repens]|uniref:F-box domain-containing protein n=1 Tax=Absidia repens TaxID=90262 RepID=A0A1X2I804_9FUNG|nr:hypothetical protein BCR42DRAFT_99792 [Absidia repens]
MSSPPATPPVLSLIHLPAELLSSIASYLDVCSLWNLLDTCTWCRYSLLASPTIWKQLEFNLDSHGLHAVYAALRRFRDDNGHGLRLRVEQISMNGTDDSMISPIVMMVKFPRMLRLSAKQRRFNTNLETDTKILQELIKRGSLQPGSLALRHLDIYHYYMDYEPHLDAYQRTLDRLCVDKVELDIRRCYDPPSTLEDQMDELQLDTTNHNDNNQQQPQQQQQQQQQQPQPQQQYCTRIISKTERCWACHTLLTRCWHCVSHCTQCKTKRLPPLANAHQHKQQRLEQQKLRLLETNMAMMDPDLKDEFSLFE